MTTKRCAVATLLYTTDYLPGVFTLGHQLTKLLRGRQGIETCLVISRELWENSLSELSKTLLRLLYKHVVQVDPLQGQEFSVERNAQNLGLLNRPELSFTLIKARLWELTDFDRVLYLDADTLPLNQDFLDLFESVPQQKSSQIAGAPDIGWPDMFNSGVLMLTPDMELASDLHGFILNHTSIDGADQGILNQFFNPNCASDLQQPSSNDWIRLPFIYNVTVPNYGYQSSPAVKYFQSQIRLVHFIGEHKPWKGWNTGDGNGYASRWNQVYGEFMESFGLMQFFEEMGLQKPAVPVPPRESEAPVVNWDDFDERIMQQEPESDQTPDISKANWDDFHEKVMRQEPEHSETSEGPQVDWDRFQERVMQQNPERSDSYETGQASTAWLSEANAEPPEEVERTFPTVVVAELTERVGHLTVGVKEPTHLVAVSSEVSDSLPAVRNRQTPTIKDRTVERSFPQERHRSRQAERVFPAARDLPCFAEPSGVREGYDKAKAVPRVDQVLEMIKQETKLCTTSQHVFAWEDSEYLQEVERVFPD